MINYLILHLLFIVYALNTVLGRMAAPYGWTDWRRFALLAGVLFLLGIYAAGWQVMLKKFNLGVAYANRAAVVIWGYPAGMALPGGGSFLDAGGGSGSGHRGDYFGFHGGGA